MIKRQKWRSAARAHNLIVCLFLKNPKSPDKGRVEHKKLKSCVIGKVEFSREF